MSTEPDVTHPDQRHWFELWQVVLERVSRAVPGSAKAAAFALWSSLHGRIELAFGTARLAPIDAGLHDAVRVLIAGFIARSPVPSPLSPELG